MPEYLAPGVYVEEIPSRAKAIEGVSTSTAALVGVTANGPPDPTLVTSFGEYSRVYGQPDDSYLGIAVRGFFENGGQRCHVVRVPPVPDPKPEQYRRALRKLDGVEDVSLVAVPDIVRPTLASVTADVVAHCERRRDRFAILATARDADVATVEPARASAWCATYFPWITVADPATAAPVAVPPIGHVAGVYARTDTYRGVWKAPADALAAVLDVDRSVTDAEGDALNERRVNPIRKFGGQPPGIRVWGARTSSPDPEWTYVNVRRLASFLERSIAVGTQWVRFEPNGPKTWMILRVVVDAFLRRLWHQGALQGVTADYAFTVRCDETTTTRRDIGRGRLGCVVAAALMKPGEFAVLRFVYEMKKKP
jgi:phage tail sheath protein FI